MTTTTEAPDHCLERIRWEPWDGTLLPVICASRVGLRRWTDTSGEPHAACRHHYARRHRRYPERVG